MAIYGCNTLMDSQAAGKLKQYSSDVAQRVILESGLTVLLFPLPHVRSVSASLRIRVGARDDPPGREGLSHMLEHVYFRGGRRFATLTKRNCALAEIGGEMDASTGLEDTKYMVSMHADNFHEGMDILLDLLTHPRFDAPALDKERAVVMDEIREEHEEWGAMDRLRRKYVLERWSGNASVLGSLASLAAMRPDDLASHAEAFYGPANAVLCIAGAFRPAEAVERAEELCGIGNAPRNPRRSLGPGSRTKAVVARRSKRQQCELLLSFPIVSPNGRLAVAQDLLNCILGHGSDSRLFLDIREERGLAYSVGSSVEGFDGSALLEIDAMAAPQRITLVAERVLAHVRDLAEHGPTEAELNRARRSQRCALEYLLDDPDALANHFSWLAMYQPDDLPHSIEDEIARIQAVGLAEEAAVASSVLSPEHATALCVGPVPDDLIGLLCEATGSHEVEYVAAG